MLDRVKTAPDCSGFLDASITKILQVKLEISLFYVCLLLWGKSILIIKHKLT